MQRQGGCNLCGQCCGGEGGPERLRPIPFLNLNRASGDVVLCEFPLAALVGVPVGGEGRSFVVRIRGQTFYCAWVPGVGLVKGTVADYIEECPFLLPDPGDGTRPCALVGTQFQSVWDSFCGSQPPVEKSEAEASVWGHRFPGCGYWWE